MGAPFRNDSGEVDDPSGTLFRGGSAGNPLLQNTQTDAAFNANRSAYFSEHQRQRLGNLVTGRSSVFAVWVTVGYFEVDENGRLGREHGADSGELQRNRAFYLYDRSIPVGFEPGHNHNVDNGVLARSIIE